jgi:hypothetical protein
VGEHCPHNAKIVVVDIDGLNLHGGAHGQSVDGFRGGGTGDDGKRDVSEK